MSEVLTVEQLRTATINLRKRLRKVVQEELDIFHEETNISPNNITVYLSSKAHVISSEAVVKDVTVDLDI